MDNKKQWIKPQLIVLGRGNPEEKVLDTCKGPGSGIRPGPDRPNCKTGGGTYCSTIGQS